MATCDYEELRYRNLEDNKNMLEKLMVDLKTQMQVPRKLKGVRKPKDPKSRSIDVADFEPRRNPSRNGRYDPMNYSPPKTRGRRGSLSSTASSFSSDSSESGNQLQVRFGFFNKGRNQESTEDDDNSDEENNLPKRQHRVQHDCRSADEITDEDLSRVAIFVSDKRYDSFYGSTCHQCRQKTDDMKTICRKGHCYGVRGQFCGPCLRNRYGEDAQAALKDPDWICPPCRGICNCSFCRKRAGKASTGILIHMARENGFSDVNAYLQNKKCSSEIPRKKEKKLKPKWGVKFGQKDSQTEENNKISDGEENIDNLQYEDMLKDLTETFKSPDKSDLTVSQSSDNTEMTSLKSPENLTSPNNSMGEKKMSAFKSVFQEKVLNVKRQPKPKVLDYEEISLQKAQVKTPKTRPSVEYTKSVEWSVGDHLWGKVTGHPWWPCQVAVEKLTGLYTKMKGKSRMYHMQFFGETSETGWVYGSSVMEFEGKEEFDDHVREVLQFARRSDVPKLEKSFKVPPGKLHEWNVAIKEGEASFKMSGKELWTSQKRSAKSAKVGQADPENFDENEKSKLEDETEMNKIKTPEKSGSENIESVQDHETTESTQDHKNIEQTQVHENIEQTQVHENTEETQVHENTEQTQVHENTEQTHDLENKESTHDRENTELTQVDENIEPTRYHENTKPTQDKDAVYNNLSEKKVVQWSVGDCLWAKLSGHPWWPCLVAADEESGTHVKMQGKSQMYHMHYFGDTCERGWVYASSVMEFKGKSAFDAHVKELFQSAKKSGKAKLEKLYKTYPSRMEWLNIAIREAESALQIAKHARIVKYGFSAHQVTPKSAESSSKAKKRTSLIKTSKRKLSVEVPSEQEPKRKRAKTSQRELQTAMDADEGILDKIL